MTVNGISWIKYEGVSDGMEALTKIRNKDKGTLSNLFTYDSRVKVRFYENVKGIAPGQSAVFYDGMMYWRKIIQRNNNPGFH